MAGAAVWAAAAAAISGRHSSKPSRSRRAIMASPHLQVTHGAQLHVQFILQRIEKWRGSRDPRHFYISGFRQRPLRRGNPPDITDALTGRVAGGNVALPAVERRAVVGHLPRAVGALNRVEFAGRTLWRGEAFVRA